MNNHPRVLGKMCRRSWWHRPVAGGPRVLSTDESTIWKLRPHTYGCRDRKCQKEPEATALGPTSSTVRGLQEAKKIIKNEPGPSSMGMTCATISLSRVRGPPAATEHRPEVYRRRIAAGQRSLALASPLALNQRCSTRISMGRVCNLLPDGALLLLEVSSFSCHGSQSVC